jgi:hypothetical protein
MTHTDFLQQAIDEISEELPGFDSFDRSTQQSLRELADHYFQEEYIPRLEGRINLVRYQAAMAEETEDDRAFIADQAAFLRSNIVRAQRAAYQQLLEKLATLGK